MSERGDDMTPPPQGGLVAQLVAVERRLKTYLARRTRNAAEADDIAQESLMRLFQRGREADIVNPEFYALSIARNLLTQRPPATEVPIEDEGLQIASPEPAAEQALLDRERLAAFRVALDRLPPLRRDVFLRRRLHGHTRERIARDLGLAPETVKKHITRAIVSLADAMKDYDRPIDEDA